LDVVSDLDRLIERRSRQNGQERPEEEMYAETVRRYNATREAENRALWASYHVGQASRLRRVMNNLVAFHEDKARELSSETKKGSA